MQSNVKMIDCACVSGFFFSIFIFTRLFEALAEYKCPVISGSSAFIVYTSDTFEHNRSHLSSMGEKKEKKNSILLCYCSLQ